MLEPSSPPSWVRPASLRWVDLSQEYHGLVTRRATGGEAARSPQWSQAWSDIVHSHRTLEALRQVGCTALTIHFDQGFGLRAQAGELNHATEFAAVCHELGFRVFAHIEAGALFYESLLAEHPGLAGWVQRTPQGDPVPADTRVPAWRPCYLSRGFLEYLKQSTTLASEEMAADGVHLMNVGPHECYCERCQHNFRRFLASRHADPQATFGLPSFEHVRLPTSPDASDLLLAELGHFRVHALRTALAELRIHLRSLSAHLALWVEPRLTPPGPAPCAAMWQLSAPADILTWEVPVDPEASVRGPMLRLQPSAHSFLAGTATRTVASVRPVEGSAAPPRPPSASRVGAESSAAMAFGGHVMTNHGALRPNPGDPTTPALLTDHDVFAAWQRCLTFAARHEHYHHGAQSLAEVALTFTAACVSPGTHASMLLAQVEEALLNACIPFDILPAQEAGATRHRVFVIVGPAPMSEQEGEVLCAVARQGRGLVLVGDAGAHDALGRPRQESVLRPVMALPHVRQVQLRDEGQGEGDGFEPSLETTVGELLPDPPAVQVLAPSSLRSHLVINALRLPTEQATFHLLNVGPTPAEGVRLRIRADLAPGRHVAWHEPDAPDAMLDSVADGQTMTTALPTFRVYGLVVTS
jgi:hypothetical protein